MYQQGLFKVVDFSLDGMTTMPGGLVLIDIELYSARAEQLASHIPQKITINKNAIALAIKQISAEETAPIFVDADFSTISEALAKLDNQAWQTADEFDVFDQDGVNKSHEFLYLTEGTQPKSKKMGVTFSLDRQFFKQHRELLPLFDQVVSMISLTLQDQLSVRYGYYPVGIVCRPGVVVSELLIHHRNEAEIDLKDVIDLAQEVIGQLSSEGAVGGLLEWLTALSYEARWYEAPNINRSIDDTGLLIGAKGWQRIATKKHIELLLSHSSLRVKRGKEVQDSPITYKA